MTRLTLDIYIRATPEDIWHALTDLAITPRYRFGLSFDTDWRAGSPLTSRSPDGEGVVHDSVPGKSLAYSWSETGKPEANGGHPSTVTFELTPMGQVTRLTTIHEDLAPDGSFLQIVQPGWPMILSALPGMPPGACGPACARPGCATTLTRRSSAARSLPGRSSTSIGPPFPATRARSR